MAPNVAADPNAATAMMSPAAQNPADGSDTTAATALPALPAPDVPIPPRRKPLGKKRGEGANKDWSWLDYKFGTEPSLAPLSETAEFTEGISDKLLASGFDKFLERIKGRKLRVATVCSGTEAPILFLNLLSEALAKRGHHFGIEHVLSCEIEPVKQTYIRRNFHGVPILRDLTEVLAWLENPDQKGTMTTAFGAKYNLPEPGYIDVIIAGTSCVNYSLLNSSRSFDLENDQNESSRTFRAYAQLVDYLRPKIAISENVTTGPYPDMIAMLRRYGYAAGSFAPDSKYYAIPQTRQRGYIIALNESSLEDAEIEKYRCEKEWKKVFLDLKGMFSRPASTPIEQWMEKSDSKALRFQIELQGKPRSLVNWNTCHARHEEYRHGQGLGIGKPMTHWRSTGNFVHTDFWIRNMCGFVERVHDATDVSHLRGILRGYDDRYYSRNLDLSQNVYVQHDNGKVGIMPCLTPNGAMFNTARGSKITGEEALRLQGIETAGLDLAGLTQSELRGFAGNAMTVTVVGAVMSFAFLKFFNVFDQGNGVDIPMEDYVIPIFRGEDIMTLFSEDLAVVGRPLMVQECIRLIEASAKYCYCEAQTEISRSPILRCKFCRHVSCSSCGLKPKHGYELLSNYLGPRGAHGITPRISPSSVEFNIASYFPMTVSIPELFSLNSRVAMFIEQMAMGDIDPKQWAVLRVSLLKCLRSTVKFQRPVRSFAWNLTWLSNNAKLELTLSTTKVQAYLYALPDHEVPVNSHLRKYLAKFPLAKTNPLYGSADSDKSIFDCTWQLWQPKLQVVEATLTYGGRLLPTYENFIGIPKHKGEVVCSEMTISIPSDADEVFRVIAGHYTAHPECEKAFNSMHTKKANLAVEDNQPLYLFFDHEGATGNWFEHGFVITEDPARKEWGVYRPIIATLPCSWSKPVARQDSGGYKFGGRSHSDIQSLHEAMTEKIQITSYGNWIVPGLQAKPMGTVSLGHTEIAAYQKLDQSNPQLLAETDCKSSLVAFSCKTITQTIPPRWPTDTWIKVSKKNSIELFDSCYHLLARGLVEHGVTEANPPWIPGTMQKTIDSRCRDCAPERPIMLWHLRRSGKRMAEKPFEDPNTAAEFERKTKLAPSPMEEWVRYTLADDRYHFEYNCTIKPAVLCHKAADLLDRFPRPDVSVNFSWRFITGTSGNTPLPTPIYSYRSTADLIMSDPPRRFVQGKKLRNEQRKTLTWMVSQERFPPTFMEREIVETRQENLAFRVEGRATRMVQHRAGLLAAAVGYGKTVMTFALLSKQYLVDREWAKKPNIDGLIHAKATLVLVPSHLTIQWREEACKFLGYDKKGDKRLLMVSTCTHVKALTVQKILDADLVICSSSQLNNDAYLRIVAKNAGVVDLANNSSDRAKEAWYINAKQERRDNLRHLQSLLPMNYDEGDEETCRKGVDAFKNYMKQKYVKNFAASGANQPHIPSRRLRGAALTQSLENAKNGIKGKANANVNLAEEDAENSFVPPQFLLDCILGLTSITIGDVCWARVIVDEISYNVNNHVAVSIRELMAQARWALSATPNIIDHLSASGIARVLGINLGVDDQETIRKDKNLTSAERFLSYGPDASPSWHAARAQVALEFCDHFVRQDFRPDTGRFNRIHRFIGMKMATAQFASYLTIKSDVTDKSYMMAKTIDTRSSVQDMTLAYGKEQDGRLRLTKAASYFPEHARRVIPYSLNTCKDLKAAAFREIGVATKFVCAQMVSLEYLLPFESVIEDEDMANRYSNWKQQILFGGRYADPDATKVLIDIIYTVGTTAIPSKHTTYYMPPYAPNGRREYPGEIVKHNGRELDGLLADCRKVHTSLHKGTADLLKSVQESRFYTAVLDINAAGNLLPMGNLKCNNCNESSPMKEAVLQMNCGHLLCAKCDVLLEDGLCSIEGCGGVSLYNQKLVAISIYSQAGNPDPTIASEIAAHKAKLQLEGVPLDQQPTEADYKFWSQPAIIVDKISAVRSIFWEHDDGSNKFIVFSPLTELLKLVEAMLISDGIPSINLQGRKNNLAQILENFKNNLPMNHRGDSAPKRAPKQVKELEDNTPITEVDVGDLYGVSDTEETRVRDLRLKRKRGTATPTGSKASVSSSEFSSPEPDTPTAPVRKAPVLETPPPKTPWSTLLMPRKKNSVDTFADLSDLEDCIKEHYHETRRQVFIGFTNEPDNKLAPRGVSKDVSHPKDRPVDWGRLAQEMKEHPTIEPDFNPTARVLLLDIADESAAGSNLTVVQHVIFMTPYLAERTKYNAAMHQAIGRAIRQGQADGGTVVVHHLLVENTVEMDITHELLNDNFPGKANAKPMLAKCKSNIEPAFFRR